MADMNNLPEHQYPNFTIEELEIIGYFSRGQKYSFSSKNLKLDFTETSIRLSDRQGKLLGISKQANEWQRKVLVSSNSIYSPKIIQVLGERGFITKQKSAHPDFTEHHYYKIPNGYKLNYTEILQLWKVWWNNKCHRLQPRSSRIDPLIFTKGNWHRIQDLQPQQEHFLLQTATGEPIICADDWVIWIDKLEPQSITLSPAPTPEIPPVQALPVTLSESAKSNMSTQIIPPPMTPISPLGMPKKDHPDLAKSLPAKEEDIDLEFYLSTFNTEDTEDVDRIEGIYNIGELLGDATPENEVSLPPQKSTSTLRLEVKVVDTPVQIPPVVVEPPVIKMQPNPAPIAPPPPPKSPTLIHITAPSEPTPTNDPLPTLPILDRQKGSLKLKAFETLTKYLREGDRVTHTETIKNTQGEVINRKTIEIQRGCPSWAIDLIKDL
jgi:hypothetical protein